ncbi:leucine-rich repeat protein SHOC-2-like [Elysia marginata]|uniref:Leucine-rich repeat protein SHOC-2-like n=1 Tax=Elysia marginata TaxID=1093978 RepID=A0AAV4HNW8_9GAST|nr:leucine-rich repeat protein SHOC-2-like [Elysia marginata]
MGNPDEAFPQSVHTVPNCRDEKFRIDTTHNTLTTKECLNSSSFHDDYAEGESVLDLSSRLITKFPGNHMNTLGSHIVHLNIEYNDIVEFPCGLSTRLPNLQIFQADGNELSHLPEDLGDFSCLTELSICENRLVALPESLMKLKSLRLLKVSSNSLRQLHSEVGQNDALEEIHIEENKLKRLPATLGLLKNIHTLIASDNRIEQLINTIGECENLKIVDLSRNKISHIPESFANLGKLVRLDLSENRIKTFCEHFTSCGSLETLFLDLNMIGKFPNWFQDLNKIQEISMKSNDLSGDAIPDKFGFKSPHLRVLDLRGNFIEVLPESFCRLPSLQVLMLGTPLDYLERSPNFQNGNWLRHLPQDFHHLTSLTKLCVEENQVLALPEDIGELVNLEELYFGSNMLDEIPASFTKLSSLRICQLSKNRLKKLPDDFGTLSTLLELYLDSNLLRNLPPSMSHLVNLEVFDLTENKLRDVPREILTCMTKLKALNMFFNKFDVPYSDIPYILKKTHYSEKNPEFKNTWRGRNNAANTMVSVTQARTDAEGQINGTVVTSHFSENEDDDNDEDPSGGAADSSAEEDWDTHVAASSSESSELTNYMHLVTPRDESDEEEDWDSEVKHRIEENGLEEEEGQFDLDDDDGPGQRFILPSPVRFDSFGNSSRPIDFAVHQHRQTPYIHHAPSINRFVYSPRPCVEGQFDNDSDLEEEKSIAENIS